LIVVGVHAGVIAYFLATHQSDEIGEYSDVMSVELAPIDSTPNAAEQDVDDAGNRGRIVACARPAK
jgi:hypothetical protein